MGDELLAGETSPMLLKIDVEGEELAVLRGAKGLFGHRRVRAVLIEVHCRMLRERRIPPWHPLRFLVHFGFTVEVRWPPGYGEVNQSAFYSVEKALRMRGETQNIIVLGTLSSSEPPYMTTDD